MYFMTAHGVPRTYGKSTESRHPPELSRNAGWVLTTRNIRPRPLRIHYGPARVEHGRGRSAPHRQMRPFGY